MDWTPFVLCITTVTGLLCLQTCTELVMGFSEDIFPGLSLCLDKYSTCTQSGAPLHRGPLGF